MARPRSYFRGFPDENRRKFSLPAGVPKVPAHPAQVKEEHSIHALERRFVKFDQAEFCAESEVVEFCNMHLGC